MATPMRLAALPSGLPFSASKHQNGTPSNDQAPKLQFSRLQEAICSSGGKMTVAQRAALLESPSIGKFGLKHRLEQDSQKENAAENMSTANAFSFWGSANKKTAPSSNVPEFQRNNKIPRTLKFESPQKGAVSADTQNKPLNSVAASPIRVSMTAEKSPEARKPLTPISAKPTHHPNTSPFRRVAPSPAQAPTTFSVQDTGRESWLPPPPMAPEESVMQLPPELMQAETITFTLPSEAAPEETPVVAGSGKKRKSSELYELSATSQGTATFNNKSSDEGASFMTAKGEEEAVAVDVQGDVVMGDVVMLERSVMDSNVFRSRPEGGNPNFENIAANLTREVQYEPSMELDVGEETLVEDGIELQCCVLQMHTKRSIEKCVESVIHDVLASKPERSIIGGGSEKDLLADVSRKVSEMVGNMESRKSTASTASSTSSANNSSVHESLNSSGGEASLTEEEVQRLREEVRKARERKQQMQTPQRQIEEQTPARVQGQPPIQAPEEHPATPQKEHATPMKEEQAAPLQRRPLVANDKPVVRDIDAEVQSAKKAPRPMIEPDLEKKLAARSAEMNHGQEDISYAPSNIDLNVRSAKKASKPIIDNDLEEKLAARRRWERMRASKSPDQSDMGGELAMNFNRNEVDDDHTEQGSSTRSLFTPCKIPDAVVVTDKDKMLAEKLAARRKWERENSMNMSRNSPAVRKSQGALRAMAPSAMERSAVDSPFKVTAWQSGLPADVLEKAGEPEMEVEPAEEEAEMAGEKKTSGAEDSCLDAKLAQRREWEGEEDEVPEPDRLTPPASVDFKSEEADKSTSKDSAVRSETKSLTDKDENLAAKLADRRKWEQRLSEMSQASICLDRSIEKGEVAENEPERVLASAILDLKELCSTMENDHAELQQKYIELEAELGKTKEQVKNCASKEQIEEIQKWLQVEIKTLEEQERTVAAPPPAAPAHNLPAASGPPAPTRDMPKKVGCRPGQCVIS